MELKQKSNEALMSRGITTNRTIVELKPVTGRAIVNLVSYQSYHSGIETPIAGIEQRSVDISTNRTIVELKR